MIEDGREPPAQYFDQPELPEHLHFYWIAFNDLSGERQIGMGIGPIPRSKIRDYAIENGMDGVDEIERLCRIIMEMDAEYVSHANSSDKDKANFVSVTDVEGQKEVFARMKARAGAATKPQRK
jgi:hypothetical protein